MPLLFYLFIQRLPSLFFKGAEHASANTKNKTFRAIKFKKQLLDLLVSLKIIPGQVLSAIIFKQKPEDPVWRQLQAEAYHIVAIPKNPYTS